MVAGGHFLSSLGAQIRVPWDLGSGSPRLESGSPGSSDLALPGNSRAPGRTPQKLWDILGSAAVAKP